MPTPLADYRAAAATELANAACYRRSLLRGLMARHIAVPAIRESLRMARKLIVSTYILGQV